MLDAFGGWAGFNRCRGNESARVDNRTTELRAGRCAEHAEVRLYTVTGMGHVWPGYDMGFSKSVGPTYKALPADEIMLDFFHQHPMPRRYVQRAEALLAGGGAPLRIAADGPPLPPPPLSPPAASRAGGVPAGAHADGVREGVRWVGWSWTAESTRRAAESHLLDSQAAGAIALVDPTGAGGSSRTAVLLAALGGGGVTLWALALGAMAAVCVRCCRAAPTTQLERQDRHWQSSPAAKRVVPAVISETD